MGTIPPKDESFEDKEDQDYLTRDNKLEMSSKGLINEATGRDASVSMKEQLNNLIKDASDLLGDDDSAREIDKGPETI